MAQISSSPKASSRSAYEPTEETIARMIEGIRIFINPQYGNTTPEEEAAAVIKINPATRKYCELKIKILQDSPKDPDKLRELLKVKERQYEKATLAEDIQSLVTEIDMLKFVQFLVNRNSTSST
jgi:hypothetical protein